MNLVAGWSFKKGKQVFKRIEVHMTGPMCRCDEQNIAWNIIQENGMMTLKLLCNGCGTVLLVPHKMFVASFMFDEPYPGKKAPKLEKIEGGKLLKFEKGSAEEES